MSLCVCVCLCAVFDSECAQRKEKFATVDRVVSDEEVVCKGLFKANYDMDLLSGLKVQVVCVVFVGLRVSNFLLFICFVQIVRESDGAVGAIRGSFGSTKNCKFKAYWPEGGFAAAAQPGGVPKRLVFRYKRYMGEDEKDPKKKWVQ